MVRRFNKRKRVAALKAVSLFSNCGAGDLGYRQAGFDFRVMAELDQRRLEVALLNHPDALGVAGDLRETWPQVVETFRKEAGHERPALLCACPPCQGMSSVQSKRGSSTDPDAGSSDFRNSLALIIGLIAIELKPSVVVVENVPAFITKKIRHPDTGNAISAAELLVSMLCKDYASFALLTDLCDYGVPQRRKRVFLTLVRKRCRGLRKLIAANRAPFPRPTHTPEYGGQPVTFEESLDAIKLPSLDACSLERAVSPIEGGLHSVPVWQDRRYKMVAAIPANSGRSAWETQVCEKCGHVEADANDPICGQCSSPLLRPIVEETNGTFRLIKGFRSSSYRRMRADQPAATITTASGHIGSAFTIHPFENRVLSPLECAHLQTFPKCFDWGRALERWGHTNVREMIGEAVPPLFTELHGKVLRGLLTEDWSVASISRSDPRCSRVMSRMGI